MTILSYNGYQATAVYEDGAIVIQLLHIDDHISTSCDNAGDVEQAFKELVDDYLETCRQLGRDPQKPYKGSLNIRLSPEMHRSVAMAATLADVSLNSWIIEAINAKLEGKETIETLHEIGSLFRRDSVSIVAGYSLTDFEVTQGSSIENIKHSSSDIQIGGGVSRTGIVTLDKYREARRA